MRNFVIRHGVVAGSEATPLDRSQTRGRTEHSAPMISFGGLRRATAKYGAGRYCISGRNGARLLGKTSLEIPTTIGYKAVHRFGEKVKERASASASERERDILCKFAVAARSCDQGWVPAVLWPWLPNGRHRPKENAYHRVCRTQKPFHPKSTLIEDNTTPKQDPSQNMPPKSIPDCQRRPPAAKQYSKNADPTIESFLQKFEHIVLVFIPEYNLFLKKSLRYSMALGLEHCTVNLQLVGSNLAHIDTKP